MKEKMLHLLLSKMQSRGGAVYVRRLGPIGGILLLIFLAVFAVVGVLGFVVLSLVLSVVGIVRAFIPRAESARVENSRQETMTVLDASGKTIASVPRST